MGETEKEKEKDRTTTPDAARTAKGKPFYARWQKVAARQWRRFRKVLQSNTLLAFFCGVCLFVLLLLLFTRQQPSRSQKRADFAEKAASAAQARAAAEDLKHAVAEELKRQELAQQAEV